MLVPSLQPRVLSVRKPFWWSRTLAISMSSCGLVKQAASGSLGSQPPIEPQKPMASIIRAWPLWMLPNCGSLENLNSLGIWLWTLKIIEVYMILIDFAPVPQATPHHFHITSPLRKVHSFFHSLGLHLAAMCPSFQKQLNGGWLVGNTLTNNMVSNDSDNMVFYPNIIPLIWLSIWFLGMIMG